MGTPELSSLETTIGVRSDGATFISESRNRKFDLLLHLAVNLKEPIVLTGPPGIGKTTYLRQFAEAVRSFATVCTLKCGPGLSHERVFEELRLTMLAEAGRRGNLGLSLEELLSASADRYRRVFLLLDDAEEMPPGLANALWLMACSHSALRLVFAVSADDCRHMAATDMLAFSAARIIEIPPLNPSECSDFVQELASDRAREIPQKRLSPSFRRAIFAMTAGCPGLIVDQLEQRGGISASRRSTNWTLWLAGGLSIAVATVVGIWFKTGGDTAQIPSLNFDIAALAPSTAGTGTAPVNPRSPRELVSGLESPQAETQPVMAEAEPDTSAVLPQPTPAGTAPMPSVALEPVPVAPGLSADTGTKADASMPGPSVPAAAPLPQSDGEKSAARPSAGVASEPSAMASPPVSAPAAEKALEVPPAGTDTANQASGQPEKKPEAPTAVETATQPFPGSTPPGPAEPPTDSLGRTEIAVDGLRGARWLLEQDPNKFTLQVVAVGQMAALPGIAAQLPPDSIAATFRSRKGRGDLYPLFVGIFDDAASAQKAVATLPGSLARGFVRPLNSVQAEIRRISGSRSPRAAAPVVKQP